MARLVLTEAWDRITILMIMNHSQTTATPKVRVAIQARSEKAYRKMRFLVINAAVMLTLSVADARSCGDLCTISWWETATRSQIESSIQSVDVNSNDALGRTPLHYAASEGTPESVRVLISVGADLNARDVDGWTPLMFAVEYERIENLKELLGAGANPNIRLEDGYHPLFSAVIVGGAVEALLSAGANPNAQDADGMTPLHYALLGDLPESVQFLIAAGADLNARDVDGWTPLHYAAMYAGPQLVEALLDAGADPSLKNTFGETPLFFANKNWLLKETFVLQRLSNANVK